MGMSSVLLFADRSLLDKPGIRSHLMRIPEVSGIIRQVQKEIDLQKWIKFDLISFVQSEDKDFHGQTVWKDFVVQLVQIGLYKRLQKSMIKPKFIVGRSGTVSALDVCLELQSLQDLLGAFQQEYNYSKEAATSQDLLVGQKLELSKMYVFNGAAYEESIGGRSPQALIEEISKDHIIDQVIALGLLNDASHEMYETTTIVESLVLDPLLSWIVPHLKSA
jgi:hypothetical protein